jgi:hypothetical protein
MAVIVEIQNTGDPAGRSEVIAVVEHVMGDRPGRWQVSIVASPERDVWHLKVTGPCAFERTYTLERAAGEQTAEAVGRILSKILPAVNS